jgi:hypothetical protein
LLIGFILYSMNAFAQIASAPFADRSVPR